MHCWLNNNLALRYILKYDGPQHQTSQHQEVVMTDERNLIDVYTHQKDDVYLSCPRGASSEFNMRTRFYLIFTVQFVNFVYVTS